MATKKTNRYEINKSASVGEDIICPLCGIHFKKKSYQQAFCSKMCKEKYWNKKRKDNGYFSRYNIEHPERLKRVGINTEYDPIECLGDDEAESLAQITIDTEYDLLQNFYIRSGVIR